MSVLARSPDLITLDVRKEITYTDILFVQDDLQVYCLEILLLDNNIPIDLTDCTLTIRVQRADGLTIEDSIDEIIDPSTLGKVRYIVKNEMYSVPGDIIGELSVYQGQKRLTTAQFKARARADMSDDDLVLADDRLPILTKLIDDTTKAKTDVEAITSTVVAKANEVDINANEVAQNKEIIDQKTQTVIEYEALVSENTQTVIAKASEVANNAQQVSQDKIAVEADKEIVIADSNTVSIDKDIVVSAKNATEGMQSDVEILKNAVEELYAQCLNVLNQQTSSLSAAPVWFMKESIADMQAITGMKDSDYCVVISNSLVASSTYRYFTKDIQGNNLITPTWVWITDLSLVHLTKEYLLGILQLPPAATSGSYNDLTNKPNRYESFITVTDGHWDYALADKIILTTTNLLTITNITNGAIGIINTSYDLTIPAGSKKAVDYDYIVATAGQSYTYTFLYNGVNYYWSRVVVV